MTRTLLLNVTYEPLRVLSLKRAIVLVLQDKAEIVEASDEEFIHSASETIPVPKVIRLKYMVQVPFSARIPLNRRTVMARDNHECQFTHCNRKGTTIDHVKPRSKGGKHEWTNVVAACHKCNAQKADRLMSEIGWELKRKPQTPVGTRWLLIGWQAQGVPEWEPYLNLT